MPIYHENWELAMKKQRRRRITREVMEWRNYYLDIVLVPFAVFISIGYHLWLWYKVRSQPLQTTIGINFAGQRLWVIAMMKDEKKNILAVQSIRNSIMGSTLMATTSILLCSALAAVLSSTYSIKKPINDSTLGGHGELMMSLKYVTILLFFLLSFLCYSLSVRFISQVNFLISVPCQEGEEEEEEEERMSSSFSVVRPSYICDLMDKGSLLNIVGNRLFYAALPLLLWISGPILVFLCSVLLVPILYHLDIVHESLKDGKVGTCVSA